MRVTLYYTKGVLKKNGKSNLAFGTNKINKRWETTNQ